MKGVSRAWLFDVAGVFLAAALPFLIFIKHAHYSLHAPEILAIFGLIFVFAVVCGLVMIAGRMPARVTVFTFLALLVVDVQTDWITTVGLRLLLNTIFFGVLFWLLRRRLSRLVVLTIGLMVLVTAVLPTDERAEHVGDPHSRPGDDADLPFVLHLILDEQIGVEGIPAEFDPEGEAAAEIRDFYLDNSFAVFGRAYSRYGSTAESIPNMLNFACAGEPDHFLDEVFEAGILLKQNAWFDLLHERGYRIHALESSHLRFFDPGEDATNPFGDSRLFYDAHSLKPLERTDLSVSQKVPFILSSYFKLSYFLKIFSGGYTGMAASGMGQTLGLPYWEMTGTHPVHIATMQVMDTFEDQLRNAGPGQAFFAHILLPHSPYGFDRNCNIEMQPGKWLLHGDKRLGTRTNTSESRAVRYPMYLDQMFCLQSRVDTMFRILRDKGLWEQAIIIIHGDHGSRISQWPAAPITGDKVSPTDMVDVFSTIFAVKGPGIEGGYHRDLLPIDHLFSRLIRDRVDWRDTELENDPWVYMQGVEKYFEKRPMPPFAEGRVLD